MREIIIDAFLFVNKLVCENYFGSIVSFEFTAINMEGNTISNNGSATTKPPMTAIAKG